MGREGTLEYRFRRQIEFDTNGGCWLWTGSVRMNGYGAIGLPKSDRAAQAHRVSWELHRGSIPEGLHVCHKCDIRVCVNPDHLFLGTRKDNMQDMVRKCRANPYRGEESRASKLTEKQVLEIYALKDSGRSMRSVGREYGVRHPAISNIWHGLQWRHLLAA